MKKVLKKIDAPFWLRQRQLRATDARIQIIELLSVSAVPLTLAEIHAKVRRSGCDFATVFRFLTILSERHLVERVPWIDGSSRYELRMSGPDAHLHQHYLICRTCQKIEPIEECSVERLESRVSREKGYTSLSHSLQLSGVCPRCQPAVVSEPTRRGKSVRL